MNKHHRLHTGLNLVLIVIFLTGLFGVQPASAQIEPPPGKPAPGPDGLTYTYSPDTGLLTFVAGSAEAPLLDPAQTAGALADVDTGAQVLAQFGAAFGLAHPLEEMRLERIDKHAGGETLRYQQQIDGIPVLGGELLLNRDADGRVLSLNGEISPNLKLRSTRPSISAERARNTATTGMKTWHGLSASQVKASQPELRVYDPNIFEPTDATPLLVWRIELTPHDAAAPVRELVLVNAATGRVALHFNQVNTSLGAQEEPQEPAPTQEPPQEEPQDLAPTPEPAPEETLVGGAQLETDPLVEDAAATDILYVSPDGQDMLGETANDCRAPASPCQTLKVAHDAAQPGAMILAQSGIFSGGFFILKDLTLSGGWDASYAHRTGKSVLTPSAANLNTGLIVNRGISAEIRHFTFTGFDENTALSSLGRLVVSHCILFNNGRAVSSDDGDAITIQNTIISRNRIGLYATWDSSVAIINSTITENTVAGLELFLNTTTPAFIRGSILSSNPQGSKLRKGELVSEGYNIFDVANPFPKSSTLDTGVFHPRPTDLLGVDPKLSPFIDNAFYALSASSPAVDAIPEGVDCPADDIRGMPRPVNNRCDIGSFEYTPAGPAVRLIPLEVQKQVTVPGMDFLFPLQPLALDNQGNLVAGALVRFTAPGSGASAILSETGDPYSLTVLTGEDGVARTPTLRANAEFGSYAVIAAVEGSDVSVSYIFGNGMPALYVDPNIGDDANGENSCSDLSAPCRSINNAVKHANPNDLILLATGVYDQRDGAGNQHSVVANITKNIILSGGWDATFRQQNGRSILDGGENSSGIRVTNNSLVVVDRVDMSGNSWGLTLESGTVQAQASRFYQNLIGIRVISGRLDVVNSHITKNHLGIRNESEIALTNVTLSRNDCYEVNENNSCPYQTAGLINYGRAVATLTNVTVAYNRIMIRHTIDYWWPEVAGGIDNQEGTVRLQNSIVAHNQTNLGHDCSGTVTSLGHNLIGTDSACQVNPSVGDIIGTRDNRVNALVGYLEEYQAETEVIPLLTGSPAIDGANPDACPPTDQRGVARPSGAACDMGAYEGELQREPLLIAVTTTGEGNPYFPNRLLCESPQEDCTGGADPQADQAHHYALGILQMYSDLHQRVSFDNAGTPFLSTVHSNYYENNAFWSGRQVVYADGFVADDVAAHEFTHGFTQYTTHLLNYYQSGAISESLSDVWGEYYDQSNGQGNDTTEARWLIGEDVSIGAFRSMSNPTRYKQPDKMTSKYYWKKPGDNGGIHTNSGINNKAVFLMVDGGIFNGLSIAPIGWDKTLAIYYYAVTRLITSGSGYDDLYQSLNQACSVLLDGPENITAEDCKQVRKALDAVQMQRSYISGFSAAASVCPSNMKPDPNYHFFDDFENGSDQWTFGVDAGEGRWSITPGKTRFFYAASGKYALFGDDYDITNSDDNQRSDSYAAITDPIYIPAGATTVLFFKHSYGFEHFIYHGKYYYIDGGVLEYSTDNGTTWRDAQRLFKSGQKYGGQLYSRYYESNNPLYGRAAFRGESHGYVSTRYDLKPLAGKSVRFRWRLGTDYVGTWFGWAVDDVAIYTCVGKPSAPSLVSPKNFAILTTYQPRLDWKDTRYAKYFTVQVAHDKDFTDLVMEKNGLVVSEFTFPEALEPNTRYYWRVRGINAAGDTSKWSSVLSFRTAMLTPVLQSPPDGAVTESNRPAFQWSASPGATSYSIQISRTASFKTNIISATVKTNAYTATKNLSAGTLYYWRVRANGGNTSAWSAPASFTVP